MKSLSTAAKKLLNDPKRIAKRDEWFLKMENVYNGKIEDPVVCIGGFAGTCTAEHLILTDPERWVVECLEDIASHIEKTENQYCFVPACVECDIYTTHFSDTIFGATVHWNPVSNQWYNDYLEIEPSELKFPDMEKSETWNIAKRAALAFIKNDVALPLFDLPIIGSALNQFVNLWSEKALLEMAVDEEGAGKILKIINNTLIYMHKWYLSVFPKKQLHYVYSTSRAQPPGFGQIDGCTTQLISADMYRNLVMPLDEELLSTYPRGGMMHICGHHLQHLESFRAMPHLRAFEMPSPAGDDFEAYFNGLRGDQVIYFSANKTVSREDALRISKGKRIILQGGTEEPVHPPM